MELSTAIDNPLINVFDISLSDNGEISGVVTYQKPGESRISHQARHLKNIEKSRELIKRGFIK